ncbi:hypothetical protein [Escherichia coli]|uniref:hypothetical protein n=1 Tax=Escherichia coli TaxID=562 RepID=UPI002F264C42
MSGKYKEKDILVRYNQYGEVIEESYINPSDELKVLSQKSELEVKRDINKAIQMASADAMKQNNTELGGFVAMYYVKNELLLKDLGLSYQDIARLLYLATYLDYNYESNLLVIHKTKTNKKPMSRVDMMEVLKVSDKTFRNFLKVLKENNIINEIDKRFYLSSKYFTKGKIDKRLLKTKEYTRIYRNPIKNLFEGVSASNHKNIGNILSLIPFLNDSFNHLENADGSFMSLTQMNNLLGYHKTNVNHLFKRLRDLKVTYNGDEHHIMTKMVLNGEEERIYINPLIAYKGNDSVVHKEIVRQMLFPNSEDEKEYIQMLQDEGIEDILPY